MHPIVFNIPQYDRGMTSSELIANSLGQGFEKGYTTGLSNKLQEMMEEKKSVRALQNALQLERIKQGLKSQYREQEMERSYDFLKKRGFFPDSSQSSGINIPYEIPDSQLSLQNSLQPQQTKSFNISLPHARISGNESLGSYFGEEAPEQVSYEDFIPPQVGEPLQSQIMPQQVQRNVIQQRPQSVRLSPEEAVVLDSMFPQTKLGTTLFNAQVQQDKLAQKEREFESSRFEKERKYFAEGSPDIEKRINSQREALPKVKFALDTIDSSLASGETGPTSINNIAKRLGLHEFENLQGATLSNASKELFFNNVSRVSARAQNMWLEQRMNSILPEIGQSKEAAQGRALLFRTEYEMAKAKIDEYDKIYEEDVQKQGYPNLRTIDRRVAERVESKEVDLMKNASFKLRQLYEEEKGNKWLYDNINKAVPKGTMLTRRMLGIFNLKYSNPEKAIENAKKLGYTIPTKDERSRWQNQ